MTSEQTLSSYLVDIAKEGAHLGITGEKNMQHAVAFNDEANIIALLKANPLLVHVETLDGESLSQYAASIGSRRILQAVENVASSALFTTGSKNPSHPIIVAYNALYYKVGAWLYDRFPGHLEAPIVDSFRNRNDQLVVFCTKKFFTKAVEEGVPVQRLYGHYLSSVANLRKNEGLYRWAADILSHLITLGADADKFLCNCVRLSPLQRQLVDIAKDASKRRREHKAPGDYVFPETE